MNNNPVVTWIVYASARAELIGQAVRAATKEEARVRLRKRLGLRRLPPQTGFQRAKEER